MKLSRANYFLFQSGRKRSSSGYALIVIIALLAVIAIVASTVVPDLVRGTMLLRGEQEEQQLHLIGHGLLKSIQRNQSIPGASNWTTSVAREAGLGLTEIAQVYPSLPSATNTSRIYLIHPSLTPGTGPSRLPYTQQPAGIEVGSTNAPTPDTRVMVVSNTRRELSLPLGSGIPSAAEFNNLWDWHYDPVTLAPPRGWPPAWSGKADGLHVKRLDLADYFHTLTLKNLLYSLDGSYPLEMVTDQVQRQMLQGSLLKVFHGSGVLYASYIVNHDRSFDLTTGSSRALLYFNLDEESGTLGSNQGSAGSSADLTFISDPIMGQSGPPALPPSNKSIKFNGNGERMESSYHLPPTFSEFTLATWIHVTGLMGNDEGIVGERDVLYFKTKDKDEITLVTYASGSVTFVCDMPNSTWHHLAAVGDGATLKIFVDGSLVATHVQSVADYGNPASADFFRLAGQIVSGSDYFKGALDEVVFYTEALTSSEIAQLTVGTVP